jgi:hypothetical protein
VSQSEDNRGNASRKMLRKGSSCCYLVRILKTNVALEARS